MATINVALQFKRDTGRYLVGERAGRDYWFEKTTIEKWEVADDSLTVSLEERLWQRRERAERPETVTPVHKIRKCLRCRDKFGAARFMYVCDPCKESQAWKEGTTIFCQ